jgi:CBS domain-containing protein
MERHEVHDTLAAGPTTVGDIMTRRVTTLSPGNTLREAVEVFEECSFRHIVVLDANGHLAGVVSDRDVLRAASRDPKGTTVADIMSRQVTTATPHMPIADAIDVVVFKRINCLPVLDGAGKVCGLVTTTDLLGTFHNLLYRARGRRSS